MAKITFQQLQDALVQVLPPVVNFAPEASPAIIMAKGRDFDFIADAFVDSLDFLEIILGIERHLGLRVDIVKLTGTKLGDLYDVIAD